MSTQKKWIIEETSDKIYIESDEMCIATIPLRPDSAALGLCSETRLKNHQINRQLRVYARLIASAPDLLEACKAAVAALSQTVQISSNREPSTCDILRGDATTACNFLMKAIDKATKGAQQ